MFCHELVIAALLYELVIAALRASLSRPSFTRRSCEDLHVEARKRSDTVNKHMEIRL